jgi:hypothetical protein
MWAIKREDSKLEELQKMTNEEDERIKRIQKAIK